MSRRTHHRHDSCHLLRFLRPRTPASVRLPSSFRQQSVRHPSKGSIRSPPHHPNPAGTARTRSGPPPARPVSASVRGATLSGENPAARPTTLHIPQPTRGGIRAQGGATLSPDPPDPPAATGLDRFNAAPRDLTETALLTCCGSRRWAERVAAHRPYPDPDSLLAASDEACYDLAPAEVDEALAEESFSPHPLVGARGPGTLAAHTALRAAHAEYERRFRHAFVICLDGYREDELLDQVLAGIRTRLGNDEDEERAVTADELRRLIRGRLATTRGFSPVK